MKTLVSLFLMSAVFSLSEVALARPQVLLPTQTIPIPALFFPSDVGISGDWMVVAGNADADTDPNTSLSDNRVYLYHRAANGVWSPGTLLLETRSNEFFARAVINSQIIVISVPLGTHVFENTSAGWVKRPVDAAAANLPSPYLDIDGTTILLADGRCGSNAVVLDRTSAGHWAQSGQLLGTPMPCSDSPIRNQNVALSANTAISWDPLANAANRALVFERAPGPTWTHTAVLAPVPGETPNFTGYAIDLRGSLAFISGPDRGTRVYRRSGSTWSRTGYLSYLDWFPQIASKVKVDDPYVIQSSYNSTLKVQLLHVFRERADQGFDELALLTTPDGRSITTEFDVAGSRVVAATPEKVFFYQLPASLNPAPAIQQYDFESGSTAQWTILPGSSFSVVSSGGTHVYRQSSTAGDAAATHPDDLTTQAIQADITPTAFNGNDRWFGLVTRYTDVSNYYYVTWRSSGWLVLKRMHNGVFTELARASIGGALNQSTRLRMESAGNRHTVFVDGFEYLSAFDDTLSHGRAGLRTYRTSADFDNVLVSAAPLARYVREPLIRTAEPFDAVDGQWAIEYDENFDQGDYRQYSVAGDARSVAWPVSDDQIVESYVRVDAFAAPAPGKEYWVGLLARYQDPSNYYYVSLRSSNQISLRRVVNGQITVLRSAPLPVAVGSDYFVRLEVVGQKLRVYVDEILMFEAADSMLTNGKSGLVTYKAAAGFAYFTAYQP